MSTHSIRPRWLTALRRLWRFGSLPPQGSEGIEILGHRGYVGGMWDEIGRLQFDFLVARGLVPQSVLLDVACGSLRLGTQVIPYLEPGHYLGIEKEEGLVRAGLEKELDPRVLAQKRPEIVISSEFEFERFGRTADFAIAQSLFTHLPARRICLCLRKLMPALAANGRFYATFFECERPVRNPRNPHDHGFFRYTRADMLAFGRDAGFTAEYLGEWSHPRGQVMVEYRPRSLDGHRGQ